MADLMTPQQVIEMAFDRAVEENKIPNNMIPMAQQRYVRPILGDDFYEAVVADLTTYSELITYIKPMLAHYIKFWALPKIHVETGSVGMSIIQGQNRQAANQNDVEKLRDDALQIARMHGEVLRQYLEDNDSSYPLYSRGSNPQEQVQLKGGIIMRKSQMDDCDDYTQYLTGY